MDQVLEDFETTTGEKNGAKVGGHGRVPALEDKNHNAALPRSGDHSPRRD